MTNDRNDPKKAAEVKARREAMRQSFLESAAKATMQFGRESQLSSAERKKFVAQVNAVDCGTRDTVLADHYAKLIGRRAVDRRRGKLLCYTGYTGAGKSHIAERTVEQIRVMIGAADRAAGRSEEEMAEDVPVLAIDTPAPCTLSSLGRTILKRLGYPLPRSMKENVLWDLVKSQLRARNVRLITLDEFHNVLIGRTIIEREKLAATIKDLLNSRIQMVMVGIPNCAAFLQQYRETRRRAEIVPLTKLAGAPGMAEMVVFLEEFEEKMDLPKPSNLADGDLPERFMKASDGYLGRVAFLIREAAYLALDDGRVHVTRDDLAVAFSAATGLPNHQNPFRVPSIAACPPLSKTAWGDTDDDNEPTRLIGKRKGPRRKADEDDSSAAA